MIKGIDTLYKYIDLMRTRTPMYIGENSITAMYLHIAGYQSACMLKNIDEKLVPDFGLFHNYVARYYKETASTAGWKNIVLKHNSGDEKVSLKVFFELFDSFRASKNGILE